MTDMVVVETGTEKETGTEIGIEIMDGIKKGDIQTHRKYIY